MISLYRIERIHLLDGHFQRLLAPETVRNEVGRLPPFVDVVADVGSISILPGILDLDPGEAQVILNGFAHPGAWLLLDDNAARLFAERHAFRIIGTLGVILRCKHQGRIDSAAAISTELRKAGMFFSDALLERALRLVGESTQVGRLATFFHPTRAA